MVASQRTGFRRSAGLSACARRGMLRRAAPSVRRLSQEPNMSRTLSWVGPALLATTLIAQQDPPEPKPPTSASAAERFAALQAEHTKLSDEHTAKVRDALAKTKA